MTNISKKIFSIRFTDLEEAKLEEMAAVFYKDGIIKAPTKTALIKDWLLGRKYDQFLKIRAEQNALSEKQMADYLRAKELGLI